MLKHSIWLLIGSIVAIFLKPQLAKVLHYLLVAHNKVSGWLALIFTHGSAGQIIQDVLALMIIPIVAGLAATLVFWLFKRVAMPHTLTTVWAVWLVLIVTILAQAG